MKSTCVCPDEGPGIRDEKSEEKLAPSPSPLIPQPNICVLENIEPVAPQDLAIYRETVGEVFTDDLVPVVNQWEEADNFGSLIRPLVRDVSEVLELLRERQMGEDLFLAGVHQKVLKALRQADYLSPKYHVVVANPPYMGGRGMNDSLKAYLKSRYELAKADLFSAFVIRNTELVQEDGQLGFMSPFVWMFISTYEELRRFVLEEKTLTSLVQLEYSGFDGATVPICAYTIENRHRPLYRGGYIKLSEFRGAENQGPRTAEAIANHDCGWFFRASAKDFEKIPGWPIAFWVSDQIRNSFVDGKPVEDFAEPRLGMATGNNDQYVRLWHEVSHSRTGFSMTRDEAERSQLKWFPYNKGGDFRRWYGNNDHVVNWENDGYQLQNTLHPSGKRIWAHNFNLDYIFQPSITWTFVSSSCFGVRQSPKGFLFDVGGSSAFPAAQQLPFLLGFLGSAVAFELLKAMNPTLNFQAGNIGSLPVLDFDGSTKDRVGSNVDQLTNISKLDWDSKETSWDFETLDLLKVASRENLSATWQQVRRMWKDRTDSMLRFEEENNRCFVEKYDLASQLSQVPNRAEATLECNPYFRYGSDKSESELEALLLADTMREFISYAVGCMLGRYSLDAPGLILANAGESIEDYYRIVSSNRGDRGQGQGNRTFVLTNLIGFRGMFYNRVKR